MSLSNIPNAIFIIRAAYDITRRSAEGLVDKSLPDAEIKLIEGIIKEHESAVLSFHRLRARKMGSDRQVDVHMIVPWDLSVKEGHDLVDHLENDIKKALPGTVTVVHMEPCDANCEQCRLKGPPQPFKGDTEAKKLVVQKPKK